MKVFLSYAREDAETASRVMRDLRARGIQSLDVGSVKVGTSWIQAIADLIKTAEAFVVLISPRSLDSAWIGHEMAIAASALDQTGRPVTIPVVVEPVDELPFLLSDIKALDLSEGENYDRGIEQLVERLRTLDRQPVGPRDYIVPLRAFELERLEMRNQELRHSIRRERRFVQYSLVTMIAAVTATSTVVLAFFVESTTLIVGGAVAILGFLAGVLATLWVRRQSRRPPSRVGEP